MISIGIVSCDMWKDKIAEDILLKESLLKNQINAEIISWEDEKNDYTKYDGLILRSVWGYHNKYKEFKKWLEMIKYTKIPLYNSPDIIMNNIRKDEQFKVLANNNIPFIDTSFVYTNEELINGISHNYSTVLKPIISGSGYKTILINNPNNTEDILNNYADVIKEEDNGVMIQPFMNGIKNGEYACVYIDGINTHNMLRFPGVLANKQKPIYLPTIPENVKQLATSVSKLNDYLGYLYMRVDIVVQDNKPLIVEVEMAEPDLLFKYIKDADVKNNGIDILSKSLIRRIK